MKNLGLQKLNVLSLLIIVLFFVNTFLYVYRAGIWNADRIGGDEVAAYVSLMPFLHGLTHGKIIPTFLMYYHEPIQQLIQLPVIVFGASVFFVRFPNMVFGILTYIVLYKIGRLLFGTKSWYVLCALSFYTLSGFTLALRMGTDLAMFNFISTLSVYYLINFDKSKKVEKFQKAFLLMILNLFIFVDGIFLFGFLFFNEFGKIKERIRLIIKMWKPVLLAFLIIFLWATAVYAASVWSNMYDWRLQAPFRILTRGSSYSLSSFLSNFSLFLAFNSIEFTILIFALLFLSIFDKRSRLVWSLLLIPFIYFNLVKMPTLHILNFWVLIILASVLGLRFLCEKKNWLKFILVPVVVLSLFRNIQQVRLRNPFYPDVDYKIAATYLRQNTTLCESVYIKTDLDGYAFRFYFDRRYVTEINEQTKSAFVDGDSSYLESSGFSKIARVKRQDKKDLSIYQKGYKGGVSDLSTINNKFFNFSNTLDYVSQCYFNI